MQNVDALLDGNKPREWPTAEFIVGNPPFLGNKKMRSELGDSYTEKVRKAYKAKLPHEIDFVCYWFEQARELIKQKQAHRVGLIATNSIRGNSNREVLNLIKETGDIFMAWSDRPWTQDGAAVRVSIVAFDDGSENNKVLDGQIVNKINADLTSYIDVSKAKRLKENRGISFQGPVKVGAFDISNELAQSWLDLPNPSGKSNRDIIKPWINGRDIVQNPSHKWIIDFDLMSLEEAQQYVTPLAYIRENIKPSRDKNRDKQRKTFWWRLGRSGKDLKKAISGLDRYIATPRVSKHRIFIWVEKSVLPDSATVAIAKEDNYTFGILHSYLHAYWALKMGTSLEDRPRYTPSTTFETFPFPYPTKEQQKTVSQAAEHLHTIRQHLKEKSGQTLTQLYNDLETLKAQSQEGKVNTIHPTYPLLLAHEELDKAVYAAYGWEYPLSDEEVLEKLLTLNLERSTEEES